MSVESTIECDICSNFIEGVDIEDTECFSPDGELVCQILMGFPNDEDFEPRTMNLCEECQEKFNDVIMGRD